MPTNPALTTAVPWVELASTPADWQGADRDGAVVIRTLMTCTLSADHRTVDGAVGAQFLSAFRSALEKPLALFA
jgi:pyruvate dehydrogenase E2 component (dihydrolipoamide acetyltransferase)